MISLKNFKKDEISEKTLNKIKEIFKSHSELQENSLRKISKAAGCFFLWVEGMYYYATIVEPFNEILKIEKNQRNFIIIIIKSRKWQAELKIKKN